MQGASRRAVKMIVPAGERPPKSQARSAGVILFSEWWSRAAATRHGVGLPKTETTRTDKK